MTPFRAHHVFASPLVPRPMASTRCVFERSRSTSWPRPNIRVTSRHFGGGAPVCSKTDRGRTGKMWPSHIFPACRFAIHRLKDGSCDQLRGSASRAWRCHATDRINDKGGGVLIGYMRVSKADGSQVFD